MRFTLLVSTLLVLATGCQAENFARYQAEQDGFSVRRLDDWNASREKGTVLFREKGSSSHATIAIRAVELSEASRAARSRHGVLESTAKVLGSYPEAVVSGPKPIGGDSDRMAFEMSFVPQSKGKRYERRHVVVFDNAHIFQLWHTAPAGDLSRTSGDFAKIIDSIREEV